MPLTSSSLITRLLLGAALLVFVGGVVLAVVQPGDLGDDDVSSEDATDEPTTSPGDEPIDDESAATEPTVTVSTAGAQESTTTTATTASSTTTTERPTTSTSTTSATTATTEPTTVTTAPGSGLGTEGVSSADDATASTGIESMLGPGIALGLAAAVLRRASRRAS